MCFPFVGDLVGGSHLSALGLICNLDQTRFSPLVVLHQPDGPLADLLHREGVAFHSAPVPNRLARAGPRNAVAAANVIRTVVPLTRFLRSQHVSIVHTNDGRTHLTWGVAARLAGAKLLWHHRGDATSFGLRRIAPWLADRVVAVSRFASPRPGLVSAYRKCSVVHSPFDVERAGEFDRSTCRAHILAELGVTPGTLLLGYVGTLVDRKRPLLFVETIAALRRFEPDLDVAGLMFGNALNGLDEVARARAAALGIGDRVHLMGFRYPVEPWVAGLDILLVPAVNEPLGRTLVEAMLLGTPVVATASGGNPEAIRDGETGRLVHPEDPDALARAVLDLVADAPRSAAIAEAALRDARARFSIDRHVSAITRLYDRLCEPRAGNVTST